MKVVNIILMVLMAILTLREGMDIVQHGPSTTNVIFGLLFAMFAVRRFMLMSKYSVSRRAISHLKSCDRTLAASLERVDLGWDLGAARPSGRVPSVMGRTDYGIRRSAIVEM